MFSPPPGVSLTKLSGKKPSEWRPSFTSGTCKSQKQDHYMKPKSSLFISSRVFFFSFFFFRESQNSFFHSFFLFPPPFPPLQPSKNPPPGPGGGGGGGGGGVASTAALQLITRCSEVTQVYTQNHTHTHTQKTWYIHVDWFLVLIVSFIVRWKWRGNKQNQETPCWRFLTNLSKHDSTQKTKILQVNPSVSLSGLITRSMLSLEDSAVITIQHLRREAHVSQWQRVDDWARQVKRKKWTSASNFIRRKHAPSLLLPAGKHNFKGTEMMRMFLATIWWGNMRNPVMICLSYKHILSSVLGSSVFPTNTSCPLLCQESLMQGYNIAKYL